MNGRTPRRRRRARAPRSLRRGDRPRGRLGRRAGRRRSLRRVPHRALAARPRPLQGTARGHLHGLSRVRSSVAAVIILIRHGQSTTNAAGLLVGRSDPPLTELGERQARALAPLSARRRRGVGLATATRATDGGARLARLVATVNEAFIEVDYGAPRRPTLAQSSRPSALARLRASATTSPSAAASRSRPSISACTRELDALLDDAVEPAALAEPITSRS